MTRDAAEPSMPRITITSAQQAHRIITRALLLVLVICYSASIVLPVSDSKFVPSHGFGFFTAISSSASSLLTMRACLFCKDGFPIDDIDNMLFLQAQIDALV